MAKGRKEEAALEAFIEKMQKDYQILGAKVQAQFDKMEDLKPDYKSVGIPDDIAQGSLEGVQNYLESIKKLESLYQNAFEEKDIGKRLVIMKEIALESDRIQSVSDGYDKALKEVDRVIDEKKQEPLTQAFTKGRKQREERDQAIVSKSLQDCQESRVVILDYLKHVTLRESDYKSIGVSDQRLKQISDLAQSYLTEESRMNVAAKKALLAGSEEHDAAMAEFHSRNDAMLHPAEKLYKVMEETEKYAESRGQEWYIKGDARNIKELMQSRLDLVDANRDDFIAHGISEQELQQVYDGLQDSLIKIDRSDRLEQQLLSIDDLSEHNLKDREAIIAEFISVNRDIARDNKKVVDALRTIDSFTTEKEQTQSMQSPEAQPAMSASTPPPERTQAAGEEFSASDAQRVIPAQNTAKIKDRFESSVADQVKADEILARQLHEQERQNAARVQQQAPQVQTRPAPVVTPQTSQASRVAPQQPEAQDMVIFAKASQAQQAFVSPKPVTTSVASAQSEKIKSPVADDILQAVRDEILTKQQLLLQEEFFKGEPDKQSDPAYQDLDKFRGYLNQEEGQTFASNAMSSSSLQTTMQELEVAGYENLHEQFKDRLQPIVWPQSDEGARVSSIRKNEQEVFELKEKVVSPTEPMLVESGNGDIVQVEKYREVDFPMSVSQNLGPMHLMMSLKDEQGLGMPEKGAVYFTAHYDKQGNLCEVSSPIPVTFNSKDPNAIGYIERGGKIYTLPVTQEKYDSMMMEVQKHQGHGINLAQMKKIAAPAQDKFTTQDVHQEQAPEITPEPQIIASAKRDLEEGKTHLQGAKDKHQAIEQAVHSKQATDISKDDSQTLDLDQTLKKRLQQARAQAITQSMQESHSAPARANQAHQAASVDTQKPQHRRSSSAPAAERGGSGDDREKSKEKRVGANDLRKQLERARVGAKSTPPIRSAAKRQEQKQNGRF